jgi:hypothetical protein
MFTQLCKHSIEPLDEESARRLLRKDWPKDISLSERLLETEKSLLQKMPICLWPWKLWAACCKTE